MAERPCPWWLGYLLVSPLRRLIMNPDKFIAPYVSEGMTVLEPGPGMGFFTLPLASRVGAKGRIIAVDIQAKMLDKLRLRAENADLLRQIQLRLAKPDSMGLTDLKGSVDFVLAFAMVHELPSAGMFFREMAEALKHGGTLLLVEPGGHVTAAKFAQELAACHAAGFETLARPTVGRQHAALLRKP